MHLRWDEFLTDARIQMGSHARTWGGGMLDLIRRRLTILSTLRGWTRARLDDVMRYWDVQMYLWHMPPPPPEFYVTLIMIEQFESLDKRPESPGSDTNHLPLYSDVGLSKALDFSAENSLN